MKKYFALLLSPLFFFACANENTDDTSVKLSGSITSPTGEHVTIYGEDEPIKIAIDSVGQFAHELDLEQGYYTMGHGRERSTIYLSPGYDLSLSLDTKEFDESLSFEGVGSEINNYLAAKYLEDEKISTDTRTLFSMVEDSFLMTNDAKEKTMLDLLKSFTGLDESFVKTESKNIKYDVLSAVNNYEDYHQYFTENKEYEATEAITDRLKDMDYGNEENFMTVPSYKSLVTRHFINGGLEEAIPRLKELESEAIRSSVVEMLSNYISPGTEELETKINDLKSLTEDVEIIKSLDESWTKMSALARGNLSPGFNYESVDGSMVDLADLQGKNVYIDVWATWCGPCKAEIPHLKKLESEYHGQNIEFVSVSVDVQKDKQKWKDMIAEKELGGVQVITENGWDSPFIEDYVIKGIPRFILLDDKGNIVSADAPRPSSGQEIKDMIDGLNVL